MRVLQQHHLHATQLLAHPKVVGHAGSFLILITAARTALTQKLCQHGAPAAVRLIHCVARRRTDCSERTDCHRRTSAITARRLCAERARRSAALDTWTSTFAVASPTVRATGSLSLVRLHRTSCRQHRGSATTRLRPATSQAGPAHAPHWGTTGCPGVRVVVGCDSGVRQIQIRIWFRHDVRRCRMY